MTATRHNTCVCVPTEHMQESEFDDGGGASALEG